MRRACRAGGANYRHDIHDGYSRTWEGINKYPVNGAGGSRQLSYYMGESYNGVEVAVMVDNVRYTILR